MKTTARITWALVSLGLLFHCVSNSPTDDDVNTTPTTAPQSTKAPEAATTPIPPTTPTVPITTNVAITPQPITSAIDTTASAASAGITQPTVPAAQATAATVPAIGGGLTTQTNQDPNPGSTPSMPATATNQSVTITPANVPTVTAAVSTVAAAAVTTAAAAPSDSTDAKTTVPTQNTSPGLTGPGKGSATPSGTTAKQGTDGTSGNVISTALTTSPVKTTPRTSNGVTLPPTIAVTEKKVTTSPLLQSTTTAPAAVSTPSKILTPSPPPPPTPPTPPPTTTVTAVETTKTISFTKGQENKKGEKELGKVCTKLMEYMNAANCTMTVRQHDGKTVFHNVQIEGTVDVTLATQYYEEITKANEKKSGDNSTLIAILASCGALLVMIVGLAIYAHHRKPYHENQQHLTEELHTVENGYHDNPTLEVMEVQPEMQEKKMALNGEFNDSWIVPIDHLLKEDLPDEEDTHL